ncbi:winged helix-turn-helix domain-containing protein [Klenkia brasiliensis]|uniref:Transcriptional regulatory protein, C terminal n=1 Tax=Klenkia brasiliensis TaxID=333142 RepID=A0A1G7PE25_9ACTN|nr:winged helix-turn-helix domain-containing protein [Klenkia brasiliensis]SDF84533.1 Transcriptional regulatory protein, C terminal [Klenkia brasiliensis]
MSAALSLPLPAPSPHLRALPAPPGSAPVALLVLTEDGRLLPPTPEQLAPLAALLAPAAPPAPVDDVHELGPLVVRPAAHVATVAGRRLSLTVREFELLAALAAADGRVVARAALLASVWGAGTTTGVRSVDVHVARLRAKLGSAAHQLVTVRGRGYRLDPA